MVVVTTRWKNSGLYRLQELWRLRHIQRFDDRRTQNRNDHRSARQQPIQRLVLTRWPLDGIHLERRNWTDTKLGPAVPQRGEVSDFPRTFRSADVVDRWERTLLFPDGSFKACGSTYPNPAVVFFRKPCSVAF